MVTRSCGIFILNFVNSLKNLYGHFWQTPEGFYKYYLKLDGYYFCRWKKCTVAVIQIRNKRTAKVLPLFEILNDKDYLKELHPADACILGILANNERNGIIDHNYVGWRQMNRSKEYKCIIKSEPILEVSRKYTNQDADEIIVLHSKFSNKEIEHILNLIRKHLVFKDVRNMKKSTLKRFDEAFIAKRIKIYFRKKTGLSFFNKIK